MKREIERERLPPLSVNRQESKPQIQRSAMVVQTRALQYRKPLIIHTFSPEVIQTNAQDFMQLVQKLTGQTSHVSPLTKRPRHTSYMHHASEELHLSPKLYNLGGSSLALRQEEQRNMAEVGLHKRLFPQSSLNSGLPTSLSPHIKVGPRMQGGISVLSPTCFEFSPSMLPSPTTFLRDFPSLLSPQAAALRSPRLAQAGSAARSPMMMLPAAFPSPGPLTSAFLADLPVLSPAAYKWIEKHPLSAEFILSPLPRGLGLPPTPSPAKLGDHSAAWDFD